MRVKTDVYNNENVKQNYVIVYSIAYYWLTAKRVKQSSNGYNERAMNANNLITSQYLMVCVIHPLIGDVISYSLKSHCFDCIWLLAVSHM